MYKVVRRINENIYEDFGTFQNQDEAVTQAKMIKAFLGYEVLIIEGKSYEK